LHPADLELLAELVVDRLADRLERQSSAPAWLTAAEVADRFRVDRGWVYEHSSELGAVRLGERGDGRRPRLRFDPETVAARLASGSEGRRPRSAGSRRATRSSASHADQGRDAGTQSVPATTWKPLE
jgi:hypothetical protein